MNSYGKNVAGVKSGVGARSGKDTGVGARPLPAPSRAPEPTGRKEGVTTAAAVPGEGAVPACPRCGEPMVTRVAKKGDSSGSRFWGCRTFPACRGTRPNEA